jgi:Rrf2 family protein
MTWMELHKRQGHETSTSEQIAGSVNTNPVVIRRLLGDLRDAGLVSSQRGAGAGWQLTRDLASITLLEVYDAIQPGPVFAMHRGTPNLECPIGFGIRPAMRRVYGNVEDAMRAELSRTTLADVLDDVMAATGMGTDQAESRPR